MRERHSGVEHAAAPYSPWNCACVSPRSFVRVPVRVYVWSARVCAREFLPYPSVVYQSVSPPPREPPPFYPVAYLARIPLFPFSSSSSTSTSCSSYSSSAPCSSCALFPLADSFLISTPYLILLFSSSSRRRRRKSQLRPDKDAKKRESGYNLWPR